MKAYNYEIYTVNEQTGETGWDIKFRTIFAETREEAKQILKNSPFFDCVILFNWCVELDMANLSARDLNDINNQYSDDYKYWGCLFIQFVGSD